MIRIIDIMENSGQIDHCTSWFWTRHGAGRVAALGQTGEAGNRLTPHFSAAPHRYFSPFS
jgi:hypothetical protein